MKMQTNTLLPELTKAGVKKLTKITEETPDVIRKEFRKYSFSAAELWRIHKQKRNFQSLRFL